MRGIQFFILALLALCSKPILADSEQDMQKCQISSDFNNFIDLIRPEVIESVKSATNVTLSSSIEAIIKIAITEISSLVDADSLYINEAEAKDVFDKYFSEPFYELSFLKKDHIDSITRRVEDHIVSTINARGFTQLITDRTVKFDLEKIFSEFDFQSYAEEVTADLFDTKYIKELVFRAIKQQDCTDDVKHFLIDTQNMDVTTEILARLERPLKFVEYMSISSYEVVRQLTDQTYGFNGRSNIKLAIIKLVTEDASYIRRSLGEVMPCLFDTLNEQIMDKVVRKWIYGVERKLEKNGNDDTTVTDALTEEIEENSVRDIMNKQFEVSKLEDVLEETFFITLNRTSLSSALPSSYFSWGHLFGFVSKNNQSYNYDPKIIYERYMSTLRKFPLEEFNRKSVENFLTEGRLYSIVSSVLRDSRDSGLLSQDSFEKLDSTILEEENNLTVMLKETLNEFNYSSMVTNSLFSDRLSYNEFLPVFQKVSDNYVQKMTAEPQVPDFRYKMDLVLPANENQSHGMNVPVLLRNFGKILDYGHDLLFNISQDELETEVMSMDGVRDLTPEYAKGLFKSLAYYQYYDKIKIAIELLKYAENYLKTFKQENIETYNQFMNLLKEGKRITSRLSRSKREIRDVVPVQTNGVILTPITPETEGIIDSFGQIEPKDIGMIKKMSIKAKKVFGKIILKLNKIGLFMKKSGKKINKFVNKFIPIDSVTNNVLSLWEGGIQKYFVESLGGLDFVVKEELERLDLWNLSLARLEEVFEWPEDEDSLGLIETWGREFDEILDNVALGIEYYEEYGLDVLRDTFGWMDIFGVLDWFSE